MNGNVASSGVAINDPAKLALLAIALIGGIAMAIVGAVVGDTGALAQAGTSLSTLALGYLAGNGRLASRGEPPAPVAVPKLDPGEYVSIDELRSLGPHGQKAARAAVASRVLAGQGGDG